MLRKLIPRNELQEEVEEEVFCLTQGLLLLALTLTLPPSLGQLSASWHAYP